AWLPEPEARSVLGPVLEGFTDATVTDVSRLLSELGRIRERGYAVSAGEPAGAGPRGGGGGGSRRCAACRLRCCGRVGTGRSRCSASGGPPTGCRRRATGRWGPWPSRRRHRSRRRCAAEGLTDPRAESTVSYSAVVAHYPR